MKRSGPPLLALAVSLVVAGCGAAPAGLDESTLSPPVSSESSAQPITVTTYCPAGRPPVGETCGFPGSVCEYGDTVDVECNARLECVQRPQSTSATWVARTSITACSAEACPVSRELVASDGACTLGDTDSGASVDERLCAYTRGLCACTTGPHAAKTHAPTWVCAPPPAAPCPPQRPRIGQACATLGDTCDYGSCLFKHGTAMRCDGIGWQPTEISCN